MHGIPDIGYLSLVILWYTGKKTEYKRKRVDRIMENSKPENKELLPSSVRDCAHRIVECIYNVDQFARLKGELIDTGKYIKIKTDDNNLRYMFVKPDSSLYEDAGRAFTKKDYTVDLGKINCRLTTQWKETCDSGNSLQSLIDKVNHYYARVVRIYEEDGKWYLESITKTFDYHKLPEAFQSDFARRYITSMLAKPFVILTGNSGTGKTRIAKQLAGYLEETVEDKEGNEAKNWLLVPVGADWTDNTKILGFYNPLADEGKGRYEKTEILRLIERADEHKDMPFFLILDEMNLSHVERYFADFLSHMETPGLKLHLDGYGELDFPDNLFVIGTVNIDETTYMFSPKVLDRANVIEFKPDEKSVLNLFLEPASDGEIPVAGKGIPEAFLKLAKEIRKDSCGVDDTKMREVQGIFQEIYKTVPDDYKFAYRTVKEVRRYLSAANEMASDKEKFDLIRAVDEQVLQKILPKIHGNKRELGDMLTNLSACCKKHGLTESKKKIEQMETRLAQVQYASFI